MPLAIKRADISQVEADAVVNAANSYLAPGGGVCGAIFAAAGFDEMDRACRKIGHCETGHAVVTPGFALPARYVIHAVGPVWRGGSAGEEALLRSAYRSAFARAAELDVASIALPMLSAGIYGYPPAGSLALATQEARRFLAAHPDVTVTLTVFDRRAFAAALEQYVEVASLISDAEVAARSRLRRPSELNDLGKDVGFSGDAPEPGCLHASTVPYLADAAPAEAIPYPMGSEVNAHELSDLLENLDASFSQTVLALIDERGLTDAEVYKRANLSRQLFSKLRHGGSYRPTKQTAVALSMALELSRDEADLLLERAGYALSRSNKFDIIVSYFIERGCYDVFRLNEMLFAFDQPLVGSL